MSGKINNRNLATAVGAALAGSMMLAGPVQAFDNAFSVKPLESGYMQVAMNEGKCGEGKCGGDSKMKEGKCGGDSKMKEGKCGEGKCGGDSKMKEGKCGGDSKMKEGKCGEGKCGSGK